MAPVAVPCMVMMYEPADKELVPLSRTVTLPPGATVDAGIKLTDVPEGTPLIADKEMVLLNPFIDVVASVISIKEGAGHDALAGDGVVKVKPPSFNVGTNTVLPVDMVRALSSYKTDVGVNERL